MNERIGVVDPCGNCSYGIARRAGLREANNFLNDEVATAYDDPDNVRLGTQDQPPIPSERVLGRMGELIDRVNEAVQCDGPKAALRIGRVSVGNVCGWYWDHGQRFVAVAFTFKPVSVRKKSKQ